jgi:hypothetical protein
VQSPTTLPVRPEGHFVLELTPPVWTALHARLSSGSMAEATDAEATLRRHIFLGVRACVMHARGLVLCGWLTAADGWGMVRGGGAGPRALHTTYGRRCGRTCLGTIQRGHSISLHARQSTPPTARRMRPCGSGGRRRSPPSPTAPWRPTSARLVRDRGPRGGRGNAREYACEPALLTRGATDKDVVRTDTEALLFSGENNPYVRRLHDLLMAYAVHNPAVGTGASLRLAPVVLLALRRTAPGYVQGLSDLLSPFVAVLEDDAVAFWCFAGLMDTRVRVQPPRSGGVPRACACLMLCVRRAEDPL